MATAPAPVTLSVTQRLITLKARHDPDQQYQNPHPPEYVDPGGLDGSPSATCWERDSTASAPSWAWNFCPDSSVSANMAVRRWRTRWVRGASVGVAVAMSCLGLVAATSAALPRPSPAAIGPSATGVTTGTEVTAADPRAAAEVDAQSLLALVPLPPGAQVSATLPVGVPQLNSPGLMLGSPYLVDAHAWWTIPSTLDATDAWELGHLPQGATLTGQGSGGGPEPTDVSDEVDWTFPPAGTLVERGLVLTLAPDGPGMVALRADAQDVYQPPRPGWSLIPATEVPSITVAIQPPGCSVDCPPVTHEATITSPATILTYLQVLNALSVDTGGVEHCPAMFLDDFFQLTLRGADATTLATVSGNRLNCGGDQLSVPGTGQVSLEDASGGLWGLVASTLGLPPGGVAISPAGG